MAKKMFVLALAACAGTAIAQNSIVSNVPGTFVDISALPSAVSLTTGVTSDDNTYTINSTVTNAIFASGTVRVCTNGFIQFGGTAGATTWGNLTINTANTNSPVGVATQQALFPYWDDMRFTAASADELYWAQGPAASFGLPASRGNVLIIQWNGVGHYDADATGTDFAVGAATYQVQIYSNISGNVAAQMLYSDISWDNPAYDNGATATIGFAAGTNGGPASVSNVLYSFDTAGSVNNGDVLSLLVPTAPTNPTGVGAITASGSGNVVLTVATTAGINPSSTGITVVGDLSSLGGSAAASFVDNGTNGDAVAGDGVFSFTVTTGGLSDGDPISVPFTVADAQARSTAGTISGTADSAGQTLQTARVLSGTGALATITGFLGEQDVDMYKINICDAAAFNATTVGGANYDTQLFLFNSNGMGVTFNDDSTGLQSTITAQFVQGTGDYYLALSHYDIDPVAAGNAALWIDTPYATERVPDGPGAANPMVGWDGANAVLDSGPYTITLAGVCYSGGGNACGAADVGGTGGVPGADNHLDNNDFVVFIDYFFNHNAIADQGSTGGQPGADGAWDNNDFVVFIDNFFNAPASCR